MNPPLCRNGEQDYDATPSLVESDPEQGHIANTRAGSLHQLSNSGELNFYLQSMDLPKPRGTTVAFVAVLIVILITIGGLALTGYLPTGQERAETRQQETKTAVAIQVELETGVTAYEVEISGTEKLLPVLERLQTDDKGFSFTTQEHSFGKFITEINETEADSTKEFWRITVNGQEAAVGVSELEIEPGDRVTFNLEQFE